MCACMLMCVYGDGARAGAGKCMCIRVCGDGPVSGECVAPSDVLNNMQNVQIKRKPVA